jgi:hypothetical protein
MFKKFTEGLVFGGGFAISFVFVWYVAAYLIYPMFIDSKIEQSLNERLSEDIQIKPPASSTHEVISGSGIPFHELSLDEQIQKSDVIALAKYEPGSDGKIKAIITELLKKDPGVAFYYNIGDEYASSSYYPKGNTSYGDGLVMFFSGSPLIMKMSMTYSGNRIRGLGDLPIELFRKKCEDLNA